MWRGSRDCKAGDLEGALLAIMFRGVPSKE
jgi:hypothetical protein